MLSKLSKEKYGSCPVPTKHQVSASLASFESNTLSNQKCSNMSRSLAIAHLIRNNHLDTENKNLLCNQDSDCNDMGKCCYINSDCPEHGKVCQNPSISNVNLPSIPFNLTITERKKGKTVILSWDSVYNKNKPTIFVVEGRWSLKSPYSNAESSNSDSFMTKWGYLAQTTNNNWIILRSINRGRWYKFRVASISKSGTFGFSQPTELFILSSAPKPPAKPQNLTINQVYQSPSDLNTASADIVWLPPKKSDLPITEYRITWSLRPNSSQNSDEIFFKNNDLDDSDEESQIESQQTDLIGSELIDAQGPNKFTLKNLAKNSIFSVELTAISKYESKPLVSSPIRVRLDTNNLTPIPISSSLVSDLRFSPKILDPKRKADYDDDEEEETFEDDEIEHEPIKQMQMMPRNSPLQAEPAKLPLIKNLSVQLPYFQNGLVKSKLSWQIEHDKESSSQDSASINAKTLVDQPMFTITWFPIKCVQSDKTLQKDLPTPITATTINTHFEIYELKHNCDYVVNVRLANSQKPLIFGSAASASISQKQIVSPQISSAQFKVPSCSAIRVIGRIKPVCYDRSIIIDNSEALIEKPSEPEMYKLLFTTPTTTTSSTTTRLDFLQKNLPKVNGIRYKLVEKQSTNNWYAVEFSWALPLSFNRNLFSGYQISVVPKEIPGMGPSSDEIQSGGYFGSVGAIVSKDQQSFVVRQLSPLIRYIFQIQTIGSDGVSYGQASNLEFVIDDKSVDRMNLKKTNRNEYDLVNNEQNNDYYQLPPAASTTSSSSPDYFLFSHSSSLIYSNTYYKFYSFLLAVFLVILILDFNIINFDLR